MIDTHAPNCTCKACDRTDTIEPSQARYRSAVAMQRLANALGIELDPSRDNCECLERLATQAERWARLDACADKPSREEIPDERTPEDFKHHAE